MNFRLRLYGTVRNPRRQPLPLPLLGSIPSARSLRAPLPSAPLLPHAFDILRSRPPRPRGRRPRRPASLASRPAHRLRVPAANSIWWGHDRRPHPGAGLRLATARALHPDTISSTLGIAASRPPHLGLSTGHFYLAQIEQYRSQNWKNVAWKDVA